MKLFAPTRKETQAVEDHIALALDALTANLPGEGEHAEIRFDPDHQSWCVTTLRNEVNWDDKTVRQIHFTETQIHHRLHEIFSSLAVTLNTLEVKQ